MVFSSVVFLCFFLPLALAFYYAVPRGGRNAVLLLASLVFYAWGEPVYLFLMLFTIALNYASGLAIRALRARERSAKPALIGAVVLNLGLLAWFKYAGFLARTLRLLPGLDALPVPAIALPIGISFYIFQSLSYTIDVYRGEVPAQRDLLRFGTYVSMFPQLIAGPIVRYRDVAAQLECREESGVRYYESHRRAVGESADAARHAQRLGGDVRLHAADLFRLFRLLRYGHRSRPSVRL